MTPNIIVTAINRPLLFNKPQVPKNNWAPRLGFAYSPGTSGNTSIRGGIGMAHDIPYDNIGVLAVPPQVGATFDVPTNVPPTTNFLAGGGLPGGGNGLRVLDQTNAGKLASNWIPNDLRWPYAINWNFGVQHSFGKDYVDAGQPTKWLNHLSAILERRLYHRDHLRLADRLVHLPWLAIAAHSSLQQWLNLSGGLHLQP